ncbi:MAG: membrane dipeptidase, partial [Hyphomonas sp.]
MKRILYALPSALLAACAPDSGATRVDAGGQPPPTETASDTFHQSLMVLDSHLDTPVYFHTPEYDFSKRGDFDIDG